MSDEPSGGRQDSHRDSWLDRLINRFSLRARESMRDDLDDILAEATEEADLSARERAMMRNVLSLRDIRVSDVMIPRADIIAVPSGASIGELIAIFRTAGHSRLPVYGDSLDEPLGMVHMRDLLEFIAAEGERAPSETGMAASLGGIDLTRDIASTGIMRDVLFVPGAMPVIDLLARMQNSRTHMALVIDEYGGTDGIVSIEDLVETVVGDIEDEHDEVTDMIVPDPEGGFTIDARAPLGDVAEILGSELAESEDAEGVGTIGGLLVAKAGRVPRRGDVIMAGAGFRFEVLDADVRRLKRLRAVPVAETGADAESADAMRGAEA